MKLINMIWVLNTVENQCLEIFTAGLFKLRSSMYLGLNDMLKYDMMKC